MSKDDDYKRDWDIEDETHKIYDQLIDRTQTLSPFRGKNMADVFIYSMSVGFANNKRKPLTGKKRSSIPFSVLQSREWLIKTIAVAEDGDFKILLDKAKVSQIAEEYANGGISILNTMVFGDQAGDPYKRMESELREILTKYEKSEK